MGFSPFLLGTPDTIAELRAIRDANLRYTATRYRLGTVTQPTGEVLRDTPVRQDCFPVMLVTEIVGERENGGRMVPVFRRLVVASAGTRLVPGDRLVIEGTAPGPRGACVPFADYVRVIGEAAPRQYFVQTRVAVEDVPPDEARPPGV